MVIVNAVLPLPETVERRPLRQREAQLALIRHPVGKGAQVFRDGALPVDGFDFLNDRGLPSRRGFEHRHGTQPPLFCKQDRSRFRVFPGDFSRGCLHGKGKPSRGQIKPIRRLFLLQTASVFTRRQAEGGILRPDRLPGIHGTDNIGAYTEKSHASRGCFLLDHDVLLFRFQTVV